MRPSSYDCWGCRHWIRHSDTAGASNCSTIVSCGGSWQVYTGNGDTTGFTCRLPQPLSRGQCLVAYGARVQIAIDHELAVFAFRF